MNLKKLLFVALFAAGSMVFADVDLSTTIRDVYIRGTCEQAGVINMTVDGDDFADASSTTPVYIRLRLDHGGLLCRTLVWDHPNNPVTFTRSEIYVPMRLEEGEGNFLDSLAVNPDALAIVRWKAGEPEIWLRVTQSSSTWIEDNAPQTSNAPNPDRRVSWSIGISASRSSLDNQELFLGGTANAGSPPARRASLPFAMREDLYATSVINGWDPTTSDPASLEIDEAVSTLLCVDLSSSNLEALPAPQEDSALNFDPISFDDQTRNVETGASFTNITLGQLTSVAFSDDRIIARGFDFGCTGAVAKFNPVSAPLCLIAGQQQGAADEGLVCVPNTLAVAVGCGSQWGFHVGSRVELQTPSSANYGFLFRVDNNGRYFDVNGAVVTGGTLPAWMQLDTTALAVTANVGTFPLNSQGSTSTTIDAGGNLLTRYARAIYSGNTTLNPPAGVSDSITLSITATVCQWYQEDPTDIVIDMDFYATNRDSVLDDEPGFDGRLDDSTGLDQEAFCDPSARLAFEYEWAFGSFTACESTACADIFFQYVPKTINADGSATGFWSGVSYVNHGRADLDTVIGNIYEADGTHWQVTFPELPIRNQKTWLMDFDEAAQAVVFADAADLENGDKLTPEVQTDGVLRDFGTLRSSMFINACGTEGDLSLQGVQADLDGYLLIGKDDVINGAYAARNTDDGAGAQSGDLPVLNSKKEWEFPGVIDDYRNHYGVRIAPSIMK
ncbi:hypothetical protein [Acanthopleuribacter pedis]|uniref:Uncharacterized protein n=1 Tax=Acanthopleuribacter pedis TaxID=442870 RepID=A0A8J7U1Z0_9BACT|nr:hypothetical protein [Acanthopleuribacter pedis]MBO1317174.1 hypothetical protein [Acanthopleuribacter pedis]